MAQYSAKSVLILLAGNYPIVITKSAEKGSKVLVCILARFVQHYGFY
jgi:hypothetical protein